MKKLSDLLESLISELNTIQYHDPIIGMTSHTVIKKDIVGNTTISILRKGQEYFVAVATNGSDLDGSVAYKDKNISHTASSGKKNAAKMFRGAMEAAKNGVNDASEIAELGQRSVYNK